MKIFTIGGFSEVGKNMTAVQVGDDVGIIDMGLYLPKLLNYEEGDPRDLPTKHIVRLGIIPDDNIIAQNKGKVKFIAFGHGHLDHLGGAPYLASNYQCPLIGTPYSMEILESLIRDSKKKIENQRIAVNPNSHKIFGKMKLEFINMTHSIPQTALVAVHTKDGTLLYANDFKLDNHPILGKKPNYERLEELGKKGVKAMIVDSLYSRRDGKTPSEQVAREMLRDVLLGTNNSGKGLIVTTFASHIARLKSIIHFGNLLKRKVVLVGRSMHKYVGCAEKIKLVNFSKDSEIYGFSGKVRGILAKINKEREKYLIVCTGNQGEPNAILSRMARDELPFKLNSGDHVVFSCRTIPTPETMENRRVLEERLRKKGVIMFKDIHQSGHASKEDLRHLIEMVNPKHIIPAHGGEAGNKGLANLAVEMGYKLGETVHLVKDGSVLEV
ncbi:MAG: RNase J family beta-CASP ribonuclease [Nanoarchaeota archaeon]|nr:RNase J family beta-CASP ribonuclease [Nanoarchaeota archaeon]